jgi:hypothetical protein
MTIAAIIPGTPANAASADDRFIVLVGDSVVAGNRAAIAQVLVDRDLEVTLDAQSGRNLTESFPSRGTTVRSGAEVVASLRDQGLRPSLWVIELGANELGPIQRCACVDPVAFAGERIDRVLAELPTGANVAWVTVHDTERSRALTHFNNALHVRGLQQIDWHAAAKFRSDWFLDDVHPTIAGVYAFADVLADGMQSYLDGPFRTEGAARRVGLTTYPTDR